MVSDAGQRVEQRRVFQSLEFGFMRLLEPAPIGADDAQKTAERDDADEREDNRNVDHPPLRTFELPDRLIRNRRLVLRQIFDPGNDIVVDRIHLIARDRHDQLRIRTVRGDEQSPSRR